MIVLLVAAAGLAGCTRGAHDGRVQASMSVSPLAALVDQPVAVTVQGLPAGARATLTARARDTDGITWSATAQFKATSAGGGVAGPAVAGRQLHRGQPHGAVHPLGSATGLGARLLLYPEAGYGVALEASVDGRVAAEATVRRQGPVAVGVVEKRLRPAKGGIYGNLYLPKHTAGKRPAVLVFSGSGGA